MTWQDFGKGKAGLLTFIKSNLLRENLSWLKPVSVTGRQARQEFGGNNAGLLTFDPAPSPGLHLAGQLSPLQESSFTPHR